jgi:hypothetical protein
LLGTLGWNGTGGTAAAGDAGGGIEHACCGVWGCEITVLASLVNLRL